MQRVIHASAGLRVPTALTLAEAWGVGSVAALHTPSGSAVSRAALNISVTLLLGHVIWGLLRATIDRHLPESDDQSLRELGGQGGGAGGGRAETLLPLLRSFCSRSWW